MKNTFYSTIQQIKLGLLKVLILAFYVVLNSSVQAQQTLCQQIGTNFTPDITVGTDENSVTNTSSLGVASWYTKNIVINGTLVINSNFNITWCNLKMGKNAIIRINPNVSFQSYFSKYFRCGNDLWTGFIAMGSSSVIGWNHIEDVNIAIDIMSANASLIVVGNLINRNFTGMNASNIAVNAILAGNKFEYTSELNKPIFGGTGPFGIKLTDCPSAVIGRTEAIPAYRNTFTKQLSGVWLKNSTATIGLSAFYNNGTGVNADYSKVWVQGANAEMRSNFSQNTADIQTKHSALTAFYCNLDSCKSSSISSTLNNNLEQVHIHDNNMELSVSYPIQSKSGIELSRSMFGQDDNFRNIIERNNIVIQNYGINGTSRSAIKVYGYPSTHDKMLMDSNTIEAFQGGTDGAPSSFLKVSVGSADNFIISRNTIRSTNTFGTGKSRWGVFLLDGATSPAEGNVFVNNDISGVGVSDDGCCAVHAEHAGPWSICSNTTDLSYRGFHFMGRCGQLSFGLNTIKDHSLVPSPGDFTSAGFILERLSSVAFIGDQECQENTWTVPDYPELNAYAAIFYGSPNSTEVGMNEFLVEDLNDANQAPPDRKPIANWFGLGNNCFQTPTDCAGQKPPHFDENDEWVRSNYPYPQTSPEVEEWQNTRYVLAKLMRYPSLAAGDVLTFKNAYNQSSAALFARFDSLMNAISTVTAGSQTGLNALEDSIENKQAQINILDATLTDYSTIPAGFMSSRGVLLGELAAFSDQRNTLLQQNISLREPLLAACQQFNNALPSNQVYEQNQKLLNTLIIQHARGIELTETDKDALHLIAQQCIQVAGNTKSAAASMLPQEEGAQYWRENPEEYNCSEREGSNLKRSALKFTLSPNPVSEILHIQLETVLDGTLTISDFSGRTVQVLSINENSKILAVPVAHLENGVYVLSFGDASGNLPTTAKFVILR